MGLGEIRLGEMGLGEMGLGEMGQNPELCAAITTVLRSMSLLFCCCTGTGDCVVM